MQRRRLVSTVQIAHVEPGEGAGSAEGDGGDGRIAGDTSVDGGAPSPELGCLKLELSSASLRGSRVGGEAVFPEAARPTSESVLAAATPLIGVTS